MANPIKSPATQGEHPTERNVAASGKVEGPEGVPVDAPDNDAPAISPIATSRMPRAEDDKIVFENSPEFNDKRTEETNHDRE